jgi:hypothetical protein
MSKASKKTNNNTNNDNDSEAINNTAPVTSVPIVQTVQPDSMQALMNMLLDIKKGQTELKAELTARIDTIEQKQFDHSNNFQTPVKNINTPISTQSTVVLENGSDIKQQTIHNKPTRDRNLVDKDLHPILNNKLELDISNAPKLSSVSLSADEYINWYNKLKSIILANPRFRLLLTNKAEDAWRLCGGLQLTSSLLDEDLDCYRWESSFIYSLSHLYTFITRLVPEEIANGIRLHMVRDRGKYNVPSRLNFKSRIADQFDEDSPFIEDVYGFMKLLEERYNTKDCNRMLELMRAFKRLHLNRYDHPQTIFIYEISRNY